MKNKILLTSVLAMTFIFTGNVYATNQNSDKGTTAESKVKQQTQNQGETSQIQTQNSEQVQTGTDAETDPETQIQQQTQQKLQDGTGTGNQTQNQNQIKNQGEETQIQNNEQSGTQNGNKTGSTNATQRRSKVANAVQEMLQVADRNEGIGQQVRTIAQTQTQNQEKLEVNLQKVQSRSNFAKFFIGADYDKINDTKQILEQNKEQIKQLNQVKNQLANQDDAQNLTQQIQTLEQANLEIENSLGTAQKGFSLLGWMFKMFTN